MKHPCGPAREEFIPEGDAGADGEAGAKAARQAHVVPRLLVGEHQGLGVTQKAPPRRGQDRPGAIADKQPRSQRLLQVLDARADRGLGDMHPVGGFEETAVGGHLEKGLDLFDVHGQGFYTRRRQISARPQPGRKAGASADRKPRVMAAIYRDLRYQLRINFVCHPYKRRLIFTSTVGN